MNPLGRPVLLVEDDADIRETLSELLVEAGFPVLVAGSGTDALDKLRDAAVLPAVIVLDLMMPVMDGWAFRDEQRKHEDWRQIPVVAFSATDPAKAHRGSLDAIACIRKPIELKGLIQILESVYASSDVRDAP